MADIPSSKLPRLPKVHGSLPKLPAFGKKAGSAAEIPALSSQATLLPDAPLADVEGGSQTESVPQPTAEAIARGIAALNAKRNETLGLSSAAASPSDLAEPSLGASADDFASSSPEDDAMAWMPSTSGPSTSVPEFSFKIDSPSFVDPPNNADAVADSFSQPPADDLAQEALPSISDSAESQPQAVAAQDPQPDPAASESSAPEFGGAAAEDDDLLQYEDEPVEDLGEKTVMISEMDDELDEENQKTQINMSAMDYDPLSGKLIVESGKTNQREYILVREKTTIGRVSDNDIAISDISMSRHHAEIIKLPEGFKLKDLDSANGSLLNGYRIRVAQLRNGDTIEFGAIRFRFEQTGGDPDELWKGEPKIEYHPNQKNKHPVSQMASSPVAMPSRPNTPQFSDFAGDSAPMPTPAASQQMESMLQRQGGGLNAPQWNTAPPPMTSPYMMGYGPNALRDINTTPTWAKVLLVALFTVFLVSVIAALIVRVSSTRDDSKVKEREKAVAILQERITKGIDAYKAQSFDGARTFLLEAQNMGKETGLYKESAFFNNYFALIDKEVEYDSTIKDISSKMRTYKADEIDEKIKYLATIPQTSIFMKNADELRDRLIKQFVIKTESEVRIDVSDNAFSTAREKVAKLAQYPGTTDKIKSLYKVIADKERAVK